MIWLKFDEQIINLQKSSKTLFLVFELILLLKANLEFFPILINSLLIKFEPYHLYE